MIWAIRNPKRMNATKTIHLLQFHLRKPRQRLILKIKLMLRLIQLLVALEALAAKAAKEAKAVQVAVPAVKSLIYLKAKRLTQTVISGWLWLTLAWPLCHPNSQH